MPAGDELTGVDHHRSLATGRGESHAARAHIDPGRGLADDQFEPGAEYGRLGVRGPDDRRSLDRKSTRLNSSHYS